MILSVEILYMHDVTDAEDGRCDSTSDFQLQTSTRSAVDNVPDLKTALKNGSLVLSELSNKQ